MVSSLDGKLRSMKSQVEEMEVKEKTLQVQLEFSSQEKLNFEEVQFYLQKLTMFNIYILLVFKVDKQQFGEEKCGS